VTIALRTQQIIAQESGVPQIIDPLGGSYFLETLTGEMERASLDYIDRIDRMGGMIVAIENGYPQKEIQEASYRYAKALESKDQVIVGVNEFNLEEPKPVDTLAIGERAQEQQCAKLRRLRERRNNEAVGRTLTGLKRAAEGKDNLMPPIVDCVRAYATLGEMCDILRSVFGEYREPPFY
jgi:methylmalonyl-CoA mutase N-terminal domain/subunit